MPSRDPYGRAEGHPDHGGSPSLSAVLDPLPSLDGIFDWRVADDTITHAIVASARRIESPRVTLVYIIMAYSDKRRCFQVTRRYNDFVSLGAGMENDMPSIAGDCSPVPRTGVLSYLATDTNPNSAFVKERMKSLERYLKHIMGMGAYEESRSFRRFMLDRVYEHAWEDASLQSGVVIQEAACFRAASAGLGLQIKFVEGGLGFAGGDWDDRGAYSTEGSRLARQELLRLREEEEQRLAAPCSGAATPVSHSAVASAVKPEGEGRHRAGSGPHEAVETAEERQASALPARIHLHPQHTCTG